MLHYMTIMVEAILDWDRLRLKCVRTTDMGDFGNTIATDKDFITLVQGRHEFKVPKSCVEGYNGSEVFLNIPSSEVYIFEVKT
jgi:hypothetical protein